MKLRPVILFRDIFKDGEIEIAKKYFEVTTSRVQNVKDKLVIGRYSVLPHFSEVQTDLQFQSAKLINNLTQHNYIAHFEYYEDIKDYTAKTWYELSQVPKDSGPWIVKGRTNSRKNLWATHMFAKDWGELVRIYSDLVIDPVIGEQGIIIRQFLDLEVVEQGVSQPFFNEWRFFFYQGQELSRGFYWVCSETKGQIDETGVKLAHKIAEMVKDYIPFVVIDIARLKNGEWKVIELNDGQMSGLSHNDPDELYSNLKKLLDTTIG
jgi:hypothetical protein